MSIQLLAEYAATIGADALKDRCIDKMDLNKLKKLISKYLGSKQVQNYNCTVAEEIDFGGFCDYARNEIIEDIRNCILSNGENHERLKITICRKAIYYAKAKTETSKQRVEKLVSDIMDILTNFYREFKNDDGTLLLVGEIERKLDNMLGAITSAISKSQEDVAKTIAAEHEETRNVVKESVGNSIINYKNYELSNQLEAIIEAKKESILEYSIFPWFRDSLRYSAVFPDLFIQPIFKGKHGTISFSDATKKCANHHVAILGEAGAGKSTLLRYLFSFSLINGRKCVYLTASEARKENGVLDKLFQYVSTPDAIPYLVFVDGIDEEFAYDYEGFSEFLKKLQLFLNTKFWLGCRSDYYGRHYNENLAFIRYELTIEPWTPAQADRFIELYAQISKQINLGERVNDLIQAHEPVQHFKSNPFQLSLIVFLAEHGEKDPIAGIYDLYERFVFRWIAREKERGTSVAAEKKIVETLTTAAIKIYNGEEYILSDMATQNSAIRNLLNVQEKGHLSYTQYATTFYHRSLAAFLVAHNLIEAFLGNNSAQIRVLFGNKLKDDVTNFVGNKFSALSGAEKNTVKQTLIKLYNSTTETEISIREQIIYYITRLGIDVSEFLVELVNNSPKDPIIRLSLAYGCVLSDNPIARAFALEYAKSLAKDSQDAVANRAWTVIYFGDVNDRDPYHYTDNENRPWQNARKARIKRFTKNNPRLKDYRFRLFDIPLFHSFLKDRGWDGITVEEYNILNNTDFPEDKFSQEERLFLMEEKGKLLDAYWAHLNLR